MIPRLRNIAIDCNDLGRMTAFWSELLSYEVLAQDDTDAVVASSADARPRIYLQKVPEPREGKNRLHIDLDVGDAELEPAIERAEGLGAHRVELFREGDHSWWVLADPEGNLFCIGRLPG